MKLAAFNQAFSEAENVKLPDHISVVGCSLISNDKQNGFGRLLVQIRWVTTISAAMFLSMAQKLLLTRMVVNTCRDENGIGYKRKATK